MHIRFSALAALMLFATGVNLRFFAGSPSLPSITVLEVVCFVSLALLLAHGLAINFRSFTALIDAAKENRLLLVYAGWAVLISVLGVFKSPQMVDCLRNLLPALFIYFLVAAFVRQQTSMRRLLSIYLTGTSLNAIFGAVQSQTGNFYPTPLSESATFKLTTEGIQATNLSTGFFAHPNAMGIFIMPAIILLIALLLFGERRDFLTGLMLTGALFLSLLSLYFTYSKGAYLWTAIGVALLLLPQTLARWRFRVGLVSLFMGVATVIGYSLWSYLNSGALTTVGTVIDRLDLWQASLQALINDRYIQFLGAGLDEVARRSVLFARFEFPGPHNFVLEQAIAYGLPGLLLSLALYLRTLHKLAVFLPHASGDQKAIGLFAFSALIAMMGEYFFEPIILNAAQQSQLFLVYALVAVLTRPSPEPDWYSGTTAAPKFEQT